MKVPNFSIIIPSLYEADGEYLKLCVGSLRESGFDGDIIVVTNGGRAKPDLRHIKGITIHMHNRDQGQCRAVNVGVQVVNPAHKYIMVSNSDMYYAPGWNKHLEDYVELNDDGRPEFKFWCMSPNLVEPTNNNGSAAPFLKLDAGYTIDEFKPEVVNEFIAKYRLGHSEDGFNLPFIINTQVWRDIGGYDTAYDPWGSNSDTDLQTKINIAGVTPVRLADVLVYHFSNKSGTFDGTHQEEWQKNFDYYTKKFGYNRDDEPKADVWYNQNMILEDKLIYHPSWEDKYGTGED